jgi:dTDP-4-amino-4,6-dideoxygalactose transaminase
LHESPYYKNKYVGEELMNSDCFSERLVRLPFFYELKRMDQKRAIDLIKAYFEV